LIFPTFIELQIKFIFSVTYKSWKSSWFISNLWTIVPLTLYETLDKLSEVLSIRSEWKWREKRSVHWAPCCAPQSRFRTSHLIYLIIFSTFLSDILHVVCLISKEYNRELSEVPFCHVNFPKFFALLPSDDPLPSPRASDNVCPVSFISCSSISMQIFSHANRQFLRSQNLQVWSPAHALSFQCAF